MNLDRHLSRVWTKSEARRPKEEWEIDLKKLDIRSIIAHGTFGTVYRGVYDGQDVAGMLLLFLLCPELICLIKLLSAGK